MHYTTVEIETLNIWKNVAKKAIFGTFWLEVDMKKSDKEMAQVKLKHFVAKALIQIVEATKEKGREIEKLDGHVNPPPYMEETALAAAGMIVSARGRTQLRPNDDKICQLRFSPRNRAWLTLEGMTPPFILL